MPRTRLLINIVAAKFDDIVPAQSLVQTPAREDHPPVLPAAVMRPILRSQEFCDTVDHKSATPPLNHYKFLRGTSANAEWQQSAASRKTIAPPSTREPRADCHPANCQTPRTHAPIDIAARDGKITSHCRPEANTITPLVYGQAKQADITERFLRDHVLSVNFSALRREATGTVVAPLAVENSMELDLGEKVTAEVVVFNRKAAHTFHSTSNTT